MANIKNEIIFVCTANTCRSPMAEALFRHALDAQDEPLKTLKVSSAGVSAFPGHKASENSVAALRKVGIKLDEHRSQPLYQEQVDNALAFFCMTETHLAMLNLQIEPPPTNAFLMRQFVETVDDFQIPDPFGMGLVDYEHCRDSMVEAIPSLIDAVRALYEAQTREKSSEESEEESSA